MRRRCPTPWKTAHPHQGAAREALESRPKRRRSPDMEVYCCVAWHKATEGRAWHVGNAAIVKGKVPVPEHASPGNVDGV